MSDDNQVSEAALARRKKFLAEKEKAGGADALIENLKARPYRLYFNKSGEIVCFTQDEDVIVHESWMTHDFSQEQLSILKGKDLSRYRVRVDPLVDNLYSIEVNTIATTYTEAEKDFLSEVEYSKAAAYDIRCAITETHFEVGLSNRSKEVYKDIYPISATINGQRLLKFFITSEHDPHIMYHYEIVSLAELITEDKVVRQLPGDLRHCSVYTVKLFDKYQRN